MLSESRVRHYIEHTVAVEHPTLTDLRTRIDERGLVHHEMFPSQIALVQALLVATRARQVLELGTFVGYSTLGIALALDLNGGGTIITVDSDAHALAEARRQLSQQPLRTRIETREGEAAAVCAVLAEQGRTFDFILLDVLETDYTTLYPICVDLLRAGGVLVIDNVLMATVRGWEDGHNVVEADADPTCDSLRKLLDMLTHDDRVLASVVPSGSGLAICTRR